MRLINNSGSYIDIDGTLLNRDHIQKIAIEKDEEDKERLVIATGLIYCYVYGKSKIKEFLAENFRKDTINEIRVR